MNDDRLAVLAHGVHANVPVAWKEAHLLRKLVEVRIDDILVSQSQRTLVRFHVVDERTRNRVEEEDSRVDPGRSVISVTVVLVRCVRRAILGRHRRPGTVVERVQHRDGLAQIIVERSIRIHVDARTLMDGRDGEPERCASFPLALLELALSHVVHRHLHVSSPLESYHVSNGNQQIFNRHWVVGQDVVVNGTRRGGAKGCNVVWYVRLIVHSAAACEQIQGAPASCRRCRCRHDDGAVLLLGRAWYATIRCADNWSTASEITRVAIRWSFAKHCRCNVRVGCADAKDDDENRAGDAEQDYIRPG